MQNASSNGGTDSNSEAASRRIRINWVILVSGTLGVWLLILFWFSMIAIAILALLGMFCAIAGKGVYAVLCTIAVIALVLVGLASRWTARGILEGRKLPAMVGCLLMIALAIFDFRPAVVNGVDNSQVTSIANGSMALVFALLLVATFRDRRYWSRPK
jgi:hypothetical protein